MISQHGWTIVKTESDRISALNIDASKVMPCEQGSLSGVRQCGGLDVCLSVVPRCIGSEGPTRNEAETPRCQGLMGAKGERIFRSTFGSHENDFVPKAPSEEFLPSRSVRSGITEVHMLP